MSNGDEITEESWDNHVDLEESIPITQEESFKNRNKSNSQTSITLDQESSRSIPIIPSVTSFSTIRQSQVKRHIRTASLELDSDEQEAKIDLFRLHQAVSDAGKYACGVLAVEVWVLDEDKGKLKLPAGGWWFSTHYEKVSLLRAFHEKQKQEKREVTMIMPGVCLAGTLWAESHSPMKQIRVSSFQRTRSSLSVSKSLASLSEKVNTYHNYSNLLWRDIDSIFSDPDKSHTERLQVYLQAGLGYALSSPFDCNGHKGIVIYFSKSNLEKDVSMLNCTENIVYLKHAADLIGAVVAVTDARRAVVISKRKRDSAYLLHSLENQENSEKATESKKSTLELIMKEVDINKESQKAKQEEFKHYILSWLRKCKGGNSQIPPVFDFYQSLWTLFGAFCGLLILSILNECARLFSNEKYYLIMGPFGALMTLQYGLSGAPASQPRNAILGQTVAGAIALSFTYIPEEILPPWIRVAIAPAFSIMAMVKLGIPHPPAGAHSVIYASGGENWLLYFIVVFGTIISVIPATLINNMSSKRQYPIYWGNGALLFPFRMMYSLRENFFTTLSGNNQNC